MDRSENNVQDTRAKDESRVARSGYKVSNAQVPAVVKRKSTDFMTKCRFNFPRPELDLSKIFNVEGCLKSRKGIYSLSRSSSEIYVNDNNPLILLRIKKSNMDIQFIAEKSLALSHYLTGNATKAEKSTMEELWQ